MGKIINTATQQSIDLAQCANQDLDYFKRTFSGRSHHLIMNRNTIKLPAIIEQANEYLRKLTNGRYEKILFSENGEGLSLLDYKGLEVHSKNLSRGTAELTYVSIRLALAGTIDGRKEWPLIMDDTFVNFDDKRTERMISLLKHISKEGNQVLFFTCHDHIAAMFNGQNIIQLTR